MIYIFTALYDEAEIFIKKFHLEKNLENTRFQEFYQKDAGIRLTVTGVGEIAAAAAVSSIASCYQPQASDILLNIGTCAHLSGKDGVFVCNKITEQASGKTFYPDLLYRHGLPEESIVTGMLPYHREGCQKPEMLLCSRDGYPESGILLSGRDGYPEHGMLSHDQDEYPKPEIVPCSQDDGEPVGKNAFGNLYDMEAAAIYQAASYFFAPHQILFLKVVSDGGMAKSVSREKVKHCMEANQVILFDFMEKISAITDRRHGEENSDQQEKIVLESLGRDLHCSKVMGDSLRQHIHYWKLIGMDYISVIQDMYREGLLPSRDKREGKLRFEELKRRLF